jgi:benzoylformate decarboxylase/acetolactate synthase-1/2/3 large subunit
MVNPSALWTAANLHLPLLTIVHNNRAYGNDEGHQDLMARTRGRPVENRGVGIYIEEPATDFATMAKSFGVEGLPAVEDPNDLARTLQRAVQIVATERRPVLVDVLTQRMER